MESKCGPAHSQLCTHGASLLRAVAAVESRAGVQPVQAPTHAAASCLNGRVWLASYCQTRVAVKIASRARHANLSATLQQQATLRNLRNEASLMATLNHPNSERACWLHLRACCTPCLVVCLVIALTAVPAGYAVAAFLQGLLPPRKAAVCWQCSRNSAW